MDADANAVEIEPVGDVTQVFVDKERLNAKVFVRATIAAPGIHVHAENLVELHTVDLERRDETKLPVGRPEHGVAFVVDELNGEVLHQQQLIRAAELIDLTCRAGRVATHRCRDFALFYDGVRDYADVEKPFAMYGNVSLQRVAVVGVPPVVGVADRVDDAPAIRQRHAGNIVLDGRSRYR